MKKSVLSQISLLSKGQRRFLIGLALIILVPFILMTGLQFHNAMALARISTDLESREDAWKTRAFELSSNVDIESLKDPANQFAYTLLKKHGELVPERRIVVTVEVPLYDPERVKKGTENEEEAVAKAASRIQTLAQDECRLALRALAFSCMVMNSTGRQTSVESYGYQFQLAFQERNSFGKRDPKIRYSVSVTRAQPSASLFRQRVFFEKSARLRERIYEDIADTCASVRKQAGNCSITGLSIASRLDRGTPMARLSASASYASLVESSSPALATMNAQQ
jgi:hypothetical protein